MCIFIYRYRYRRRYRCILLILVLKHSEQHVSSHPLPKAQLPLGQTFSFPPRGCVFP